MELNVNISGYEGPLDLLLDLSKKQKVDIKKISILELADQYLDFIDMNVSRLKLSADYLVMASLLAYLKSKLLLPNDESKHTIEPKETKRFYDNRQNYLSFINTTNEKWQIAQRAAKELNYLKPIPPALRLFDAGMGDAVSYTHLTLPTTPYV